MHPVHIKTPAGEALAGEKQERIYTLDWLRMLAILGVFLIHSGNMFDMLYKPVSAHRQTSSIVDTGTAVDTFVSGGMYFLNFLPQWGMSLFFLLSGAGTWFALRQRTSRQFMNERLLRLLLPLIAGCIIIAPFQAYFEALSNLHAGGNLFQFYPSFLLHIRPEFNPQWVGSFTHHLWFLADLFVFSLIALPLCLYLKRSTGQKCLSHLATLCERSGGLLILFLPIALIQVALQASFPGYQNWSDVGCWLMFYLYGYILFSTPRFRKALQRQGKQALWLGIVGFLAILALSWVGLLGHWITMPDYSVGCLLFQVLASWNLWCWLIAILSLGLTSLNFKHSLLTYGSAASFPFYLLHFPAIVVVAYYVLPWHMDIIAAFVCISFCAFLMTLALTDLLFMHLSGTRMLFGKKIRRDVVGHLLAGLFVDKRKRETVHCEIPPEMHTRVLTGALR